jgi:hypothetical protein
MKSISPQHWGPSGWSILHRISFYLSSGDIDDVIRFFQTLQYVLPCTKCRRNISTHLNCLPIPDKVGEVPKWVWKLHTRISKSIKTDYMAPSWSSVKAQYSSTKGNYMPKDYDYTQEHAFLFALEETHPSKRSITPEHVQALATFMKMYVNSMSIDCVVTEDTVKSKTKLKHLIQKITKVKHHESFTSCEV